MDYRYRFIVYLILLILSIFLVGVVLSIVRVDKPLTEANRGISERFYYQPKIPYVPVVHTYGTIIDGLIECESNGNPEAVGKAGEVGILQFMPNTFQHYCVEKYNYRDDITNPEIQKECCAEMLKENWDNVYHWTCYKLITGE